MWMKDVMLFFVFFVLVINVWWGLVFVKFFVLLSLGR